MSLETLLYKLKLDCLHATLDAVCEHASKAQLNYPEFLEQALSPEWVGR